MRVFVAVLILTLGRSVPAAVRDCGPVVSQLYGDIAVSTFAPGVLEIGWTALETADIEAYRVLRVPAAPSPASSSASLQPGVQVATINASLDPRSRERGYQVIDTSPPGTWTYRLEVLYHDGAPCTFETAAVAVPNPSSCGSVNVCSQARATFSQRLVPGADTTRLRLEWRTQSEDGSVSAYRLSRLPPGCTASSCAIEVATLEATGSCGAVTLRGVTVSPPPGDWTYRLEVLSGDGTGFCTIDSGGQNGP